MKYNIVRDDGAPSSATVFLSNGDMLTATNDHPNFKTIIDGLEVGTTDETLVTGWFDVGKALDVRFRRISERVYVKAGKVYFDAMPQNGALADTIIAFFAEGNDNLLALVNFMEKIMLNPNPHSREHLFRWIKANKFGITEDGDIIGYKGVNKQGRDGTDEKYTSTQRGYAIVNGEPMTDYIPQVKGTVIEMPRDMVTFDPNTLCSVGLHVADWNYASGVMRSGAVLQVLVNPRDVVSITHDHMDRKMRVCRYKVLGKVNAPDEKILFVDREIATMTARAQEMRKPAAKVAKKAAPPTATEKAKKAGHPVAGKVTKAPVQKATAAPKKSTVAKKAAVPAKKAAAPIAKGTGKPAAKATVPKDKLPKYYEEFTAAQFKALPYKTLQWLVKEWEITVADRSADAHVIALTKAAKARTKKAKTTDIK